VVPFGQLDLLLYDLLDLVHNTPQVITGDVGRDHNLAGYILAVDGVGSRGRSDLCDISQRCFLPVGIHNQVAQGLCRCAALLVDLQDEVVGAVSFIYLRNNLSCEHHVDDFRKLG